MAGGGAATPEADEAVSTGAGAALEAIGGETVGGGAPGPPQPTSHTAEQMKNEAEIGGNDRTTAPYHAHPGSPQIRPDRAF